MHTINSLATIYFYMFERLRRNHEIETTPEMGPHELFEHTERYAEALLDKTGRTEAICSEVALNSAGSKAGGLISVFYRTEAGYQIDFYLNSTQPIEIATFDNISEDPTQGPQAYRSTFSNMRLPYDQLSYANPKFFVSSLESMFGKLPQGIEIDQPYDRFAKYTS